MSQSEHPFLWTIKTPFSSLPKEAAQEFSQIIARILENRGIDSLASARLFLHPDYERDNHDPAIFLDTRIAVERIAAAIANGEQIMIHGDYDADGVCGAAVLYLTLKHLGAVVDVYLPHRDTEGYGLNMETVQSLADVGTKLIVTVDCGISNAPEVTKAHELGMDVIVTDHHSEPLNLPTDALAILNPKLQREQYPFLYLAGVGVGFKLCQALLRHFHIESTFEKWLLDLVAISTITDCVELLGENRMFVHFGLRVLHKNRRIGIAALCAALGIDPVTITTETIGFKIGPHVNAAGRLKHANAAFELFVTDDKKRAEELARDLVQTNLERQRIVKTMVASARLQVAEQTNEPVMVVFGTDWPVGLVGLVAGNITGETGKPTFALTMMNNEIVGSGRSIEQFSLVAALQSMEELFSKYGGHPMACGFSLKDDAAREEFIVRMRTRANEKLADVDLRPTLHIDAECSFGQIDVDVARQLETMAPFGQANPEPLFVTKHARIVKQTPMGKNGSHVRLMLEERGKTLEAVAFRIESRIAELEEGKYCSLVYTVGLNRWNGNERLQLFVKDFEMEL